jgi:hypothetical protein
VGRRPCLAGLRERWASPQRGTWHGRPALRGGRAPACVTRTRRPVCGRAAPEPGGAGPSTTDRSRRRLRG